LPPQAENRVVVYTKLTRAIVSVFVAVSRASLPFLLYRVWRATDPPITPPMLFVLLVILTIVPGLAGWVVARLFRATVDVDSARMNLKRAHVEIEFPASAIERIEPWGVPLPGPGFSVRMRSGRLATYGVQIDDPLPLMAALDADAASSALQKQPIVAWAHARAGTGPTLWLGYAGKFGLFALPVAGILFNAHQHIAYGGFWGQYYLEGPAPYARTAAIYFATVVAYLVLYAGTVRAIGEAFAFVSAHLAPTSAMRVRRFVERFCLVAYYLGVPILLALRFRP
jgi:hypothetical protein